MFIKNLNEQILQLVKPVIHGFFQDAALLIIIQIFDLSIGSVSDERCFQSL